MVFTKDPDAVLDYQIDWSAWLGEDTIVTSSWIVQFGITKGSDSKTDTLTIIWLSGGTAGKKYTLVNRIITLGGRIEDRTITINCVDR